MSKTFGEKKMEFYERVSAGEYLNAFDVYYDDVPWGERVEMMRYADTKKRYETEAKTPEPRGMEPMSVDAAVWISIVAIMVLIICFTLVAAIG